MKIIITGSLGNISRPLAEQLTGAGHQVTVISSNAGKTAEIEALGATAAIGSLAEPEFLAKTFAGADIVYTMVPPNFGAANLRQYMAAIGKSYAEAIKQSGVTKIVNLSSIGAHLKEGTGPIAGIHDVENILNQLENVSIKHLRAPFFYINFYNDIPLIKHQGILGANYPAGTRLVMVHPQDIAAAVAAEISRPFNEGKKVIYLASDESTMVEIAHTLGAAIGNPGLPWVEFTDEAALNGMLQAGLPQEMAAKFTEMGIALRRGILWEDFDLHQPAIKGSRKLEDFAKEFAVKFNS